MAAKPLMQKAIEEMQIDCEVAAEVLTEVLAFCAKELAEERDAEYPNQEKIETLEKQVLELKRDKMSIGADDQQSSLFLCSTSQKENRSKCSADFS